MTARHDDPCPPNAAAPHTLWRDGWLRAAQHHPCPNCNDRPLGAVVDLIVVHSISLPPGEFGTGAVHQLFSNQLDWDAHPYYQSIRGLEVSAHFFISRTGQLWQFVDTDQRAWHAGVSHYRGRDRCNDDSIGIELEGLEGGHFTPAQYDTLAHVCQCITQRYPIAYIAGHEHIASGRKHDPGAGFDWHALQQRLACSDCSAIKGIAWPPPIQTAV